MPCGTSAAGITFRDITPVFGEINPPLRIAFRAAAFAAEAGDHRIDAVACVETRAIQAQRSAGHRTSPPRTWPTDPAESERINAWKRTAACLLFSRT